MNDFRAIDNKFSLIWIKLELAKIRLWLKRLQTKLSSVIAVVAWLSNLLYSISTVTNLRQKRILDAHIIGIIKAIVREWKTGLEPGRNANMVKKLWEK